MALFVSNGMSRNADTQLHLLQRFLVAQSNARDDLGSRGMEAIVHRLHVLEVFGHEFHELVVIQIPSR